MHDVITMTDSMRSKYARTHSMQTLTSMPMVSDVSGQILKQMMSFYAEYWAAQLRMHAALLSSIYSR